jgi:hypothetical protein
MHIDASKKFDRRNVERNIKNGVIAQKEYEIYLSRLSDVSDKIFNPEESTVDVQNLESAREDESLARKRGEKKRAKSKGK